MSLKKFNFLPIYSKDKNDLYKEFYELCIKNSIQYDRMTGYFGSSIFAVISEGLQTFIGNQGKIRIICSPIISSEDYDAIIKGYNDKTNQKLTKELIDEIEKMSKDFSKSLDLLSKLIKFGILEIKLAIFLGNNSSSYSQLVHDKIGVFSDKEGNKIAFGGSMNETYNGISNHGNLESFSVYSNWENEKDTIRVYIYSDRFDEIWNKKSKSVLTYEFPDEVLSVIKKYSSEIEIDELINQIFQTKISIENSDDKWVAEKGKNRRKAKPHQIQVLDNWEKNGRRGIFEMATGSGKTFTALCAIRKAIFYKEIPLIIVPSSILLYQWKKEIDKAFTDCDKLKVLLCGDINDGWKNGILNKFTNPNVPSNRIIISTIQTASSDQFLNQIVMSDKIFIIVDEVHRSGSERFSNIFKIESGPRIGLSATPKRFRDKEGTDKIYNYFENEIEPKYDLFQAIKDGILTPYKYNFSEIYLTNEEQLKWNEITQKINKKIMALNAMNSSNDLIIDQHLQMLLINRSRIVKKARNKTIETLKIISENYKENQSWLIYCEDKEQLRLVFDSLSEKGYRTFYYTSDMKSDKEETLKLFEQVGGIIVSIKCLDEGVDIPSVSHALILASSTNPREYIQRRGRVLRKSPFKKISHIFDCITLPNNEIIQDDYQGLSIIKSEIARSLHFAENAENKVDSIYRLNKIAINYSIDLQGDKEGGFEYE